MKNSGKRADTMTKFYLQNTAIEVVMTYKLFNKLLGMLIVISVFLSGCVQTNTNPTQIQSGGLVQIGLGGIKRNAGGKALTVDDLTATITDKNGTTFPIQIYSIFRVYPDNASSYIISRLDPDNGSPTHDNTVPFDGGWYIAAILTDLNGTPLPLAIGNATISVTSAKLQNLKAGSEGDLTKIKIKILSGTTTAPYEQTEQFNYYRSINHLTLNPSTTTGISSVGGATIKLTYNNAQFPSAIPPQVVPVSHDPNVQVTSKLTDNGNGTSSIVVNILNPRGFVPLANWSAGKSMLEDLNLMVVPQSGLDQNWMQHISIDSANSYYIDLNGSIINGVTPILDVVFL